MYKVGQWLCTLSDLELRTRSSGLGVPLGSVELRRWVAGDLRATLDVDPNPNGILPLHLLVTLNTDPWSVIVQQVGQQKREGVVGGSVSAGVENPSIGAGGGSKGELAVELMDVGLKEWWVSFCVQQRMYVGFLYGQAWHGYWSWCVSLTSLLHLSKHLEHPPTPTRVAAAALANTDDS